MNAPDLYRRGQSAPTIVDFEAVPVESQDDRLDLRTLVATFRRRLTTFLAVAAGVFLLAVLLTLMQDPRYTTAARVVLNSRPEQVTPRADARDSRAITEQSGAVDTEVEVIRSRQLAERVTDSLGLVRDPEFNALLRPLGRRGKLTNYFRGLTGQPLMARAAITPRSLENSRSRVVDAVQAGVIARRVSNTFALDIAYVAAQPETAARLANEYARLYTREQQELKTRENLNATTFLSGRIEQLRAQAQADTAAVQLYRIRNNLLSTSGASLTEQEISAYNQQVAASRAQAAEDQARLSTARAQLRSGSTGEDVGEALSSSVISSLRAQRAAVSGRVADLQGRYGSRHPEMLKATRELTDIDAQIQAEINRVISNLEARVRVSRERVASLTGSLSNARGVLTQNNRAMVGLDELERKAATSQALYESYLNRYKETAAEEGTERPDARLLSEARVPLAPSSPRVGLNLFLGLVLGIGAGVAAAFLSEMLFSGLTTAEDVEHRLGRRYLGGVPLLSSVLKRAGAPTDAVIAHPRSAYAEAFRSLLTSIRYTSEGRVRTIGVTSALPQEGKTTLSLCLARSIALNGEKVVILDCDTRKRGLNRFVRGRTRDTGLLEVLEGAPLSEALVYDEASGASILPLNRTPAEGHPSLAGAEMDRLLEELGEQFDYVILDTAPVLPIAETRSIATKVDALVFVVRWRKTPEHAVQAAFRLLPPNRVNVAGVALAQVDMRKQARYGYGDPAFYYKHYKGYYA